LALAARAKRPDLPIVIMTGYVDVNIVDAQLPEAQLLKKPFRISDLALAVERVLRRGEGEADSGKIVSLRRASRAAGNFSAAD
jgi:FixJ family two-component response regulator